MDITSDELDQERADHEAGHYVVAYAGRITHVTDYITVIPALKPGTSIMAGGCCALNFVPETTRDQWGIYSVAGMCAQYLGIAARNG